MLFSVIIPLYNKASYVRKAIESVLAQTYTEWELIVMDDGSVDDSLAIARRLAVGKDGRMAVYSQPNAGVSAARNNGVKRAKGDCICFLDADDWWEPTFLQEMRALIKEYPDAGVYGCGYFIYKKGRKRIAPIGVEAGFDNGYIDYCRVYARVLCMPLWTGAIVIPRSVFELLGGFKQSLRLGEDFDLWIRIALRYPVVFLNKQLSYYNQDVDQKNRAVGKLHDPRTHMLWNLDYLSEEERRNPDLKQLLDNLRVYSLFPYYLDKHYREIARLELRKVDWGKQSEKDKRKYKKPIWSLKLERYIRLLGSKIKNLL